MLGGNVGYAPRTNGVAIIMQCLRDGSAPLLSFVFCSAVQRSGCADDRLDADAHEPART